MKGKHRKQLARRASKRARDESQEIETVTVASKPKRGKVKHLGRVHGVAPKARADRKTRRRAREFGGGLPPASNDNEDFETRLGNAVKDFKAGSAVRVLRPANDNGRFRVIPGDQED